MLGPIFYRLQSQYCAKEPGKVLDRCWHKSKRSFYFSLYHNILNLSVKLILWNSTETIKLTPWSWQSWDDAGVVAPDWSSCQGLANRLTEMEKGGRSDAPPVLFFNIVLLFVFFPHVFAFYFVQFWHFCWFLCNFEPFLHIFCVQMFHARSFAIAIL